MTWTFIWSRRALVDTTPPSAARRHPDVRLYATRERCVALAVFAHGVSGMTSVAICCANVDDAGLETRYCPTCKTERGFLLVHYEWYGWDETCLFCGDRWADGQMIERPFLRGWRAQHVADAMRTVLRLSQALA